MKKKDGIPLIPPIDAVPFGSPLGFIPTDPQGSYTGVPEARDEVPVQDADDL